MRWRCALFFGKFVYGFALYRDTMVFGCDFLEWVYAFFVNPGFWLLIPGMFRHWFFKWVAAWFALVLDVIDFSGL